jgi:hypothetical protein
MYISFRGTFLVYLNFPTRKRSDLRQSDRKGTVELPVPGSKGTKLA